MDEEKSAVQEVLEVGVKYKRLPLIPEDTDPRIIEYAWKLYQTSFMSIALQTTPEEEVRYGLDNTIKKGDLCVLQVTDRVGPYLFFNLLRVGQEEVNSSKEYKEEDTKS